MAKPEKNKGKKEEKPKAEVVKPDKVTPLRAEINFPTIYDLKQAIGADSDGKLFVAFQFKAPVDQYEIFRLVNLLKQPHSGLHATIGSDQTALDFKFTKDGRMEIVKAEIAAEKTKKKPAEEAKVLDKEATKPQNGVVKIEAVSFNHIPEEEKPFGVFIQYAKSDASSHDCGGRGMSPTEAVIAGVHAAGIAVGMDQPFEVREALEKMPAVTPDTYKLIRVLDVGSFDTDEGGKSSKKGK